MPRPRKTYSYVDEWKSQWEPDLEAIAYNGNSCDPTRVDPKVLRWAKENCADKPHFIKIINSGAANGRPGLLQKNASSLTVPSPFVREHFRKLERVVTLENEDGRTWRVSFGAPKRDPQWLQGWERVATDNDFKPGDVVVFVLVENSRFRFTVFNEDGNISEKSISTLNYAAVKKATRCSSQESHEAPSVSNLDEHPKTKKRALVLDNIPSAPEAKYGEHDELVAPQMQIPVHEQIAEPSCKERRLQFEEGNPKPGETPLNTSTTSHDPRNPISTNLEQRCGPDTCNSQKTQQIESIDPVAFTFKSTRRMTTAVERQRAMDAAMAHAAGLTEHHFVTVMSETQVYTDFHLVLPETFVRKSCYPTSATRLNVVDCDGKPWEMFSKQNKLNEVAIHRKFWALFALNHLLEQDDVCVFHLKKNESSSASRTMVLQVHIFRVVPIRFPDRISIHDHFETHPIQKSDQ